MLMFTMHHNLEVHQVDMKSAYLNGKFNGNEVIFMSVPLGINLTDDPALVLHLLHPLYGLHQSMRHWHKKLHHILEELLDMKLCNVN